MASRVLLVVALVAVVYLTLAHGLPSKQHKAECKTDQDCTKTCSAKHSGSTGHCDAAKKHCICDKSGKHKSTKAPASPPATPPHARSADHANATADVQTRDTNNVSLPPVAVNDSSAAGVSPGPSSPDSTAPADSRSADGVPSTAPDAAVTPDAANPSIPASMDAAAAPSDPPPSVDSASIPTA